jgi:Ran GTPase-activating protein (RanGAP) involved in mRNA processing and transport
MKQLKTLRLADCNMGDKGFEVLLKNLTYLQNIDKIDVSGNQIGKSPFFTTVANELIEWLTHNGSQLYELSLNNNMLRGQNAVNIMNAICSTGVSTLNLAGNFLGQKTTHLTEAPINMISDFLIKSPMIERLDVSNNLINA